MSPPSPSQSPSQSQSPSPSSPNPQVSSSNPQASNYNSRLETQPLPPFSPSDRLMVLAPHEDDEILAAGGLIQRAVAAGAAVRVAYLTYGDHNLLAFVMYRGRPWLHYRVSREMGELRRLESVEAMSMLGVGPERLLFLGYPDHCILPIWRRHWSRVPAYYTPVTHARKVPYASALAHGHPHRAESMLADVERAVGDFRPTHVAVSHPCDGHPDHRALYQILEAALMRLADRLERPRVLCYVIHLSSWPLPARHPSGRPSPRPAGWDPRAPHWTCPLSEEERTRKEGAILCFRSQLRMKRRWLLAFARGEELFESPDRLAADAFPAPLRRQLARRDAAGGGEDR